MNGGVSQRPETRNESEGGATALLFSTDGITEDSIIGRLKKLCQVLPLKKKKSGLLANLNIEKKRLLSSINDAIPLPISCCFFYQRLHYNTLEDGAVMSKL